MTVSYIMVTFNLCFLNSLIKTKNLLFPFLNLKITIGIVIHINATFFNIFNQYSSRILLKIFLNLLLNAYFK